MSAIDIIIVAIVSISVLIGGFRGVFKEAFSLAAWVIGLWLAFHHYSAAGQFIASFHFHDALSKGIVADIVGFFAILAGVFLVLMTACWLVKNVICLTGLTPIDRILGLVFGLARGVVIVIVLVYLAEKTSIINSDMWKNSQLIQPFKIVTLIISNYIPDDFPKPSANHS
jgi:membrane protein required for colicin V production